MCKIMIIPGVKPEYQDKAWTLARNARPFLTAIDSHAFGYAALGRFGVFGEKWTNVSESFRVHHDKSQAERVLNAVFGETLKVREQAYESHGEYSRAISSLILHARYATCERNIANAHPFFREGHALIHNGVIENANELRNITSTCDSETILNEYVESRVAKTPQNIQRVADKLEGWYACAVLAPTGNGYVLDVFKGNASLVCGYVHELETLVFATTEAILRTSVKRSGMKLSQLVTVPDGVMYRFNAENGELIAKYEFTVAENAWKRWLNEAWPEATSARRNALPATLGLSLSSRAEINGEEIDLDEARSYVAEAEQRLEEHLDELVLDDDEDDDDEDERNVIAVDEHMRRKGVVTHGELVAGHLKRDRS